MRKTRFRYVGNKKRNFGDRKTSVTQGSSEKTVVIPVGPKTVRDMMSRKLRRSHCPRKETLMQFASELATVKDVDTLVAFERKLADPKIYGQPPDFQGALEEINKNTFYFIKMGKMLVGTAAYSLRPDKSIYVSNVAVDPAILHSITSL